MTETFSFVLPLNETFETALDLDGARVGVPPGTELESAVLSFFASRGLTVTLVPIETQGEAREAFLDREIDSFLMSSDTSESLLPVGRVFGPLDFLPPILNNDDYRPRVGGLSLETIEVETAPRTFTTQGSDFVTLRDSTVNEQVDGLEGDDRIRTGAGDDVVIGGAGNDTLVTAEGDDTLFGGAGADRLHGGAGQDFVTYEASATRVVVSLDGEAGRGGEARGDRLFGIEVLMGSRHDDVLRGADADDTIAGGGGGDVIFGEGGDDVITGNGSDFRDLGQDGEPPNADRLFGGEGDDTVFTTSSGEDILFGGAGNDWVFSLGGPENHHIFGGDGDDVVVSSDGDDTLYGGNGDDQMGGEGGDNLVFGGAGNDTLFTGDASFSPGADTLYGGLGDDLIVFKFESGDGALLIGGAGDDRFRIQGNGANSIFGGAGNDLILLERSPFTAPNLEGESSPDETGAISFTHGGDGEDTFVASRSNDHFAGGVGADTFAFISAGHSPSDRFELGKNIIREFSDDDTIAFFGTSLTFDDLLIQNLGGGRATLITVDTEGSTGSIRLNGVDAATIDADDFVFEISTPDFDVLSI